MNATDTAALAPTIGSNAPAPDAGLLNLQVHLDLAPQLDVAALRAACERVVASGHAIRLSFVQSEDDGPHIDACFEAFNAADLWSEISGFILADPALGPQLAASCVAVRTGSEGWDDYQLLMSYCEAPDPA